MFVQPRDRGVVYKLRQETYLYLFLAYLVSTATVVHLLSSSTIIETHDAIFIIARYSLSTVICRVILMVEVCGMKAAALVETKFM